jgi:dinuclear metal center YbgI/SA1388 family protein
MAQRNDVLQFADELLSSPEFSDYCTNGLQVHGSAEVTKIATAVSCSLAVFEAAAAAGAQMLLVHHGRFWTGDPLIVDQRRRDRLRTLFAGDINLVGYHLPLDAHPEIGNNALICEALGLAATDEPFAVLNGKALGVVGEYEGAVAWEDFLARVESVMERAPLALGRTPSDVRRVAICSGGSARSVHSAAALGADAFITGEPREDSHVDATEAGIAFIAAGHYATETFGIRALGDRLATEFGLTHTFIPSDNPV